jgi:hypothetical protein
MIWREAAFASVAPQVGWSRAREMGRTARHRIAAAPAPPAAPSPATIPPRPASARCRAPRWRPLPPVDHGGRLGQFGVGFLIRRRLAIDAAEALIIHQFIHLPSLVNPHFYADLSTTFNISGCPTSLDDASRPIRAFRCSPVGERSGERLDSENRRVSPTTDAIVAKFLQTWPPFPKGGFFAGIAGT